MPENSHTEQDTIATLLERYQVDMPHARHVALLAGSLFDGLQPVHALPARMRELLEAGAMLHNVGVAVDEPNHHLAGRDIIVASTLQGFDPAERVMLACMVAFHRKPVRPADEPLFTALPSEQQHQTLVLSAILRVADGLDYSQSQTTEIEEIGDQQSVVSSQQPVVSSQQPQPLTPSPQPLLLKVRGPHSHEDAARAMQKADLWNTLFPPLQITGFMTRPGIAPGDTIAHAGRRILRYQSELLSSREWRLDEGATLKPKQIHQLRVATRRLRSTLRVFKPYYKNKAIQPIVSGVRDLADTLAVVRELDISVSSLKRFQHSSDPDIKQGIQPLMDDWRLQRDAVRAACASYLRGERHAVWLQSFTDFVQSDHYDRALEPGYPYHLRHIVDLILAQHIADTRAYDTLPGQPTIVDVHAMRIAIKRLRYISDALRDVLPPDRVEQIIAVCTPAQDEYGLIHDAHLVAERALRFVADHRTDTQRVDQHVIRSILAFAEAQQRIVESHLGQWREHLMPLLML